MMPPNPQLEAQIAGLSTGQLVQLASSPLNAMEYPVVLAAIGQRMKAGEARPPNSTVLDDLRGQAAQQSSGAPMSPITSGIATMAQQQAPRQMWQGGPVYGNDVTRERIQGMHMRGGPFIVRSPDPDDRHVPQSKGEEPPRRRRSGSGGAFDYLRALQRNYAGTRGIYDDIAEEYAENPEEALEIARRFRGEDRLVPFAEDLERQKGQAKKDYQDALGPLLIQTGASMMGKPTFFSGVGAGGMAFAEGQGERKKARSVAERENFNARLGIATAQQRRDDATGDQAAGLYGQGMDVRSRATQAAISGAASITGDQAADARQAREQTASSLMAQFEQLLDVGFSEEEARAMIAARAMGGGGGGRAAGDTTADDAAGIYKALIDGGRPAITTYEARNGPGSFAELERRALSRVGLQGGIAGSVATTEQPTNEPTAAPRRPTATQTKTGTTIQYPPPATREVGGYTVRPAQ